MNTLKHATIITVIRALVIGFLLISTAQASPNLSQVSDEQLGEVTAAAQQMNFIPIVRFLVEEGSEGLNATTAQSPPHLTRLNQSAGRWEVKDIGNLSELLAVSGVVQSVMSGLNAIGLVGQFQLTNGEILIRIENTHVPVVEVDMNVKAFTNFAQENLSQGLKTTLTSP